MCLQGIAYDFYLKIIPFNRQDCEPQYQYFIQFISTILENFLYARRQFYYITNIPFSSGSIGCRGGSHCNGLKFSINLRYVDCCMGSLQMWRKLAKVNVFHAIQTIDRSGWNMWYHFHRLALHCLTQATVLTTIDRTIASDDHYIHICWDFPNRSVSSPQSSNSDEFE